MLVNMGKCSQGDVDEVDRLFSELDADGGGTLDVNDIREFNGKAVATRARASP